MVEKLGMVINFLSEAVKRKEKYKSQKEKNETLFVLILTNTLKLKPM